MYVILAEKRDQAFDYYNGLAINPNLNEKMARAKGYIEVYNPAYFDGQPIVITWAIGHLTELKEPHEYRDEWKEWSLENLPIIPEKFEYRPSMDKNPARQYQIVEKLLKNADTIVWAGDNDREGCYISYSICCLAGVWGAPGKTFKSLWIDELDPKVVRKGFKNLQSIDLRYHMALEAQARAYSDWLIGMNASRLLTVLLREKLGLVLGRGQGKISVGRIISPTLFFIYQREKEIENFVSRTYYELESTFTHPNGTYVGKYIPPDIILKKGPNKGKKWKGDFDTKKQWEQLINNPRFIGDYSSGKIVNHEVDIKHSRSPRLFSLGDLQKLMDKRLGLEPDQTLAIVQELYEIDKMVTYSRTSSNHIGKERYHTLISTAETLAKILDIPKEKINVPDKPDGYFVSNKKARIHAALTPTEIFPTMQQLGEWPEEKRTIYIEIVKRCLAMFLPKYTYEQTTIITQVGSGLFKTIGNVPKDAGWKILWQDREALIDEMDIDTKKLIQVQQGDKVKPTLNPVEKKTSKPSLYTSGTLLDAMETAGRDFEDEELRAIMKETEGLGTEATRAEIIKHIREYNWVSVKKGKLHLTPLGRLICQSIEGEKLLCDAKTTALWEQSLRKISSLENTQETFVNNIKRYLGVNNPTSNLFTNLSKWVRAYDYSSMNDWLEDIKKKKNGEVGQCPKCQGEVCYRIFEKDKKKSAAMYCTNSWVSKDQHEHGEEPTCDFSIFLTIANKTLTEKDAKMLLEKGQTRLIKGFKGKKKLFDARVTWDKEKILSANTYATKFLFETQKS
ncbi:DNA topoisomerase [Streptococcus sp. DTU_2020_1000888_1_SI_GRL_NUU_041A]|uniref:DNA topoisomerase n=1 Tax=Streptococcus sp. DTU_2020_1000888_1_SI_GRL_NUU_041A TaxID=3077723 RepID=UPI0028EC8497|nr:DNA topoisomerase [Streptococcus sp. DTU_2020_1000888_1_SI_GRL_NUU_041A]WNU96077.1 DNA topoisomerase [Streptococcus sp. DTU_2020_1000888_1_SI_GRL_NUU_041A]